MFIISPNAFKVLVQCVLQMLLKTCCKLARQTLESLDYDYINGVSKSATADVRSGRTDGLVMGPLGGEQIHTCSPFGIAGAGYAPFPSLGLLLQGKKPKQQQQPIFFGSNLLRIRMERKF